MSVSSSLRKSLLALSAALPLMAGAAIAQTPPATAPRRPAATVDPAKVVARVNGVAITEADLAVAAADPALQLPNLPDEQKRELLIGYLVDLKLGARAAEAAKVGDDARFRPQARLYPRQDPSRRISRAGGQEGGDAGGRQASSTTRPSRACRPSRKCAPATSSSRRRRTPRRPRAASRAARTSPRSRANFRPIPAPRPTAAISASSPRTAWSSPSPRPPSSWSPGRSPTR